MFVPPNSLEPWELLAKGEDPNKAVPSRVLKPVAAAPAVSTEQRGKTRKKGAPSAFSDVGSLTSQSASM